MWPEEREYHRAVLRTLPLLFVVVVVALAIGIGLDTGPLVFSVLVTAALLGLTWWRTRDECRAMMSAARERRAQRESHPDQP